MLIFPGYEIRKKIYSGAKSVVYRAIDKKEQRSVIIKLPKARYPSLKELNALRREYEILKNLDHRGIVKAYKLEKYQHSVALILEDFGGQSLWEFLRDAQLSYQDFLLITISLTDTLIYLHQVPIIHKDIKPENIIINPESESVKLTDFSIADRPELENQPSDFSDLLTGTLAYISPEQTGRMNRRVDYRSDFYSLGVTCYQMLVGKLPFTTTDPMELVYSHLAKQPIPPVEVNEDIPAALSDIVMKLLAKNAEDRYQSGQGLKADLEICLAQLKKTGKITNFKPGKLDRASQLIIPQKLYGRSSEVATLIKSFERASCGATEMTLVSGFPGIGKTSVINEIHKSIVQQHSYFINGKFDQFKRNIPYAAIVQAFQSLLRQLLTETAEKISRWQEKLLSELGDNGQVIVDIIPEVELIIGSQPAVPQLGATESQNRFDRVFKEFVRVFTQPEHTLVLFLDDLQWADSASLKLIELLLSDPESQYLLLIGAYRDNEVSLTHPLIETIDKICSSGATVNNIVLQPLSVDCVGQLVADTLGETEYDLQTSSLVNRSVTTNQVPQPRSQPLAELVFHKTGGNPFFITQLLQTLHSEKLLLFDFTQGIWQWNIKKIQDFGLTNYNVVELVAKNLQKLPVETQQVLKLAACIGNQFNLEVLAIVHQKSLSDTAADLRSALQAGSILSEKYADKIPLVFDNEAMGNSIPSSFNLQRGELPLSNPQSSISYKFLHDRVQQAAYSLIPESDKKQLHLRIGKLLLKHIPSEKREENIFDIVNQLNIGVESIAHPSEREELIKLNLIAGKKAKAATAYEAAVRYLNVGLQLLSDSSWQSNYELTLALHVEAVEAQYLNTNFEQAKQLSEIVLSRAKTLLEKVKVYEIQIQYYIAQSQMKSAINTALPVLKMLGVSLPQKPSQLNTLVSFWDTQLNLASKRIEDLYKLQEMTKPEQLAAMRILTYIVPPTYITYPALYRLVVFKMVNLCLKYGNSPLSTFAYSTYGPILCGWRENIDLGYRFSQLALKLFNKFDSKELKPKVYLVFNVFVRHWKEHIRASLEPLLESIQSGLETGDLENACHCTTFYLGYLFWSGECLEVVDRKQSQYIEMLVKYKQEFQINHAKLWSQLVSNLLRDYPNHCHLSGPKFNRETMLPLLVKANNNLVIFAAYLADSFLSYLFKDYARSIKNASLAEKYSESVMGMVYVPLHNLYYSLALLATYTTSSESEQKNYLKKVVLHQKKMKEWAFHCPANYLHKYELVEAEKARVLGQDATAMEYYDRAIQGARKSEYIQEEALANELAAEFYLSRGREKLAQLYLTDAYYGYIRWQAWAKVKDLEERYDRLTNINTTPEKVNRSASSTTTERGNLAILDLSSVIKVSQIFSEENVLDKLLSKLMQILIENAGAQKGLLFLIQEKSLILAAAATLAVEAEGKIDIYLPFAPIAEISDCPISLINYVRRTRKTVVVNPATGEELFTQDSYIVQHQPQSALALPVIHQGELRGILYLENRLIQGVFTEKRLESLKILTSQVAISIEIALLYEKQKNYAQTLEIKVAERTEALQKANQELKRLATMDGLTGVANRRRFDEYLSSEWQRMAREQQPLSLILCDVDFFKLYNDRYGHQAGDDCLVRVAQAISGAVKRPADLVARYGGEEFAIILPNTNMSGAVKVGQAIRLEVKQLQIAHVTSQVSEYVTLSLGVASIVPTQKLLTQSLLASADRALYEAKKQGRDRLIAIMPIQ